MLERANTVRYLFIVTEVWDLVNSMITMKRLWHKKIFSVTETKVVAWVLMRKQMVMRILELRTMNSELNLAVHTVVMRFLPDVPDKTGVEE